MIWSIITDFFKDMAGEYIDSAKDQFFALTQRLYIFLIIYISSILMLCFAMSGLIQKLAEALDSNEGFYWRNSMTLYSAIILIAGGLLYHLSSSRKKKRSADATERMIEDKIDMIIRQRMSELKDEE